MCMMGFHAYIGAIDAIDVVGYVCMYVCGECKSVYVYVKTHIYCLTYIVVYVSTNNVDVLRRDLYIGMIIFHIYVLV